MKPSKNNSKLSGQKTEQKTNYAMYQSQMDRLNSIKRQNQIALQSLKAFKKIFACLKKPLQNTNGVNGTSEQSHQRNGKSSFYKLLNEQGTRSNQPELKRKSALAQIKKRVFNIRSTQKKLTFDISKVNVSSQLQTPHQQQQASNQNTTLKIVNDKKRYQKSKLVQQLNQIRQNKQINQLKKLKIPVKIMKDIKKRLPEIQRGQKQNSQKKHQSLKINKNTIKLGKGVKNLKIQIKFIDAKDFVCKQWKSKYLEILFQLQVSDTMNLGKSRYQILEQVLTNKMVLLSCCLETPKTILFRFLEENRKIYLRKGYFKINLQSPQYQELNSWKNVMTQIYDYNNQKVQRQIMTLIKISSYEKLNRVKQTIKI